MNDRIERSDIVERSGASTVASTTGSTASSLSTSAAVATSTAGSTQTHPSLPPRHPSFDFPTAATSRSLNTAAPVSVPCSSHSCMSCSIPGSSNVITTPDDPTERSSLIQMAVQNVQQYTPPIESVRTVFDDFQDFIQQGNMIDLAIGLILGRSFTEILNSFVVDVLTPILSLFSQRSMANYYFVARCPRRIPHCTTHTWDTWKQARDAGAVTINYGLFLENIINFLINAMFLYVAIKKVFELVFRRSIFQRKLCPYCKEFIKGAAVKCKECGSDV